MAEIKASTRVTFKTIEDVENKFNFKETTIEGGKLLSLEAVGNADRHETVGTFEETEGKPFGKGELTFRLDNGGTNTAWINGVKIKVSFS